MARPVTWSEVASRLADSRTYWLSTVTKRGAPHAAPVWGVVVDDVLYLYTERHSVKAHNLANDPRVVLHLESGEDVVIVHGEVADLGKPQEHPEVMAALDAKYPRPEDAQYLPSADDAFDALYAVRPHRALLWQLADWDGSQQRWDAAT